MSNYNYGYRLVYLPKWAMQSHKYFVNIDSHCRVYFGHPNDMELIEQASSAKKTYVKKDDTTHLKIVLELYLSAKFPE